MMMAVKQKSGFRVFSTINRVSRMPVCGTERAAFLFNRENAGRFQYRAGIVLFSRQRLATRQYQITEVKNELWTKAAKAAR